MGRDERGAVAVEFALLALVLIMLLFGIIQFGLYFHRAQALQAASHEGARLGALQGTTVDEIVTRLEASLATIVGSEGLSSCSSEPSPNPDEACWGVSDQFGTAYSGGQMPCSLDEAEVIVVTVRQGHQFSIPGFTGTYRLEGSGEFRCER